MNDTGKILKNSKLTAQSIEDHLLHPVLQTADYQPREVFGELKDISDTFFTTGKTVRMVGLAGLRETGKSTLLWQTARYIFHNYTQNIYFFHLGHLKKYDIGIKELHEALETYLANGRLSSYKEKIVLLFDEIHEDPQWAGHLKVLYDLFPVAFAIATGSSALLLQSTADLVSRMFIQHIYPLSFREYIDFTHSRNIEISDTNTNLENILFRSENIDELSESLKNTIPEFDNYLNKIDNVEERMYNYIAYHNIIRFLMNDNKVQVNSLIVDLIRRVIFEDIPGMTNETLNPLNAEKILRRLAASDEINIRTLSQTIGISKDKINKHLDILTKAELLNVLYPYGGIDSKLNKTQKYFFMSPSIRRAVLTPFIPSDKDKNVFAKMLEDIVVLYLKRIFKQETIVSFSSEKGRKNPDLIIETIDNPIIFEVGMKKTNTDQLQKSKINFKYGIIINAKTEKMSINQKNRTVFLPLKYFLLLP